MSERRDAGRASNENARPEAAPAKCALATHSIGRRRALALLGGVMAPALASAQESPVAPTPTPTPTPTFPPITFAPRPTPAPAFSSGSALGPVDKEKAYFLFFQQNIDLQTVKTLRGYLVALVEGGVKEIAIVISSNGGLLTPALQLYSLILSLPVKIKTHAQVFVGSAANILYLAGAERSTDANAKFLFHPSQTPIFGVFNSPQFEDQLRMMNESDEVLEQIYRDRTKLPDVEIKRFQHETVVYSAAKAVEFGIAQRIGELSIPGDGKAKLVFVE
ncbi:MAG: ATP-dependent Clp protease proteolytic subunit [Roseiarcus sp.]|jgi:ATP-dependent protease ClpP protease subunit